MTASGAAAIGPVAFAGEVTRGSRGSTEPARAHRIFSVRHGLPTPPRDGSPTSTATWPRPGSAASCTVASGTTATSAAQGVTTGLVSGVASRVSYLHRPTGSNWALVACGGPAKSWLQTSLAAGDAVSLSMSFDKGPLPTLISGGRVLVENGRPFDDVNGQVIARNLPNPETFACVSATGRYVLLGAVDAGSCAARAA